MSVLVGVENVLGLVAESDIVAAPASREGSSTVDLVRGDLDRGWGSDLLVTAIEHRIDIHLPEGAEIDTVALFDVRPVPMEIEILEGGYWPWVGSGSQLWIGGADSRGDALATLADLVGGVTLRIAFRYAQPTRITVGKIWAGTMDELPGYFLVDQRDPAFTQIRNETVSGGVSVVELGTMRERFAFRYNHMLSAELEGIRYVWRKSRGGLRPVVLVPLSSQMSRFFFGRFANSLQHQTEIPGISSGLTLEFQESGRRLGAP